MARKIYTIENLCCANCAAKIEAKFNDLPEVEEATIVFPTKQLRLTAADPDTLLEKLTQIAQTVEPDVQFHAREEHHHHEHHEHHHDHGECGCGHEHHHDHGECGCGHEHHHKHGECGCGHEHHNHEGCACGHDHHGHHHEHCSYSHHHEEEHAHEHHHEHGGGDGKQIILGAVLFAVGLILEWIGLGLIGKIAFVAAYLILGREVLITAAKNLTRGHMLDENFLMGIATIGAFFIGEFAEAVGVMLFYRVGELFEERAVARSRSQIMEAVDLRPEVVTLVSGETIPAGEAKAGDVLIVRPGDRIPLDGVVVSGESRIDTAPITGEPVPVAVRPGSSVTSGCINTAGQLTMRAEKELSESMVTRILDCVENAAASKPKIDRFITRFARIYTPIVVGLAAIVAVVPSFATGNWNYWVYTALSFLVMSCPCALVLSVPLAFFSGIGAGSKRGILFKGGLSIEAMSGVKAVVMDKTGTLTKGDFRVQEIAGGEEILTLAACCEQHSSHPIAASIVEAARERGIALEEPEKLEEIAGRGIRAVLKGRTILCGSEKLLTEQGIALPEHPTGGTVALVAVDGKYMGHLLIADTLKSGAKDAVAKLKAKGIATAMLTGDSETTAREIAERTGIDEVRARLLPEDKLTALQQIRSQKGAVMYVGDGINDAPVLAGADVGAAMGSGADAAIEAADVVFMTSDAEAIPAALEIASSTRSIAWQNVYFALAVKAIVMLLGLGGHASMWLAVFADSGVAMLCVLNSIRLLYRKR